MSVILSPIRSPIRLPVYSPSLGRYGEWTPQLLSGLVYWYDFSDFSSMYQDSAGTTALTGSGDPVGLVLDKSGNGYHRTQATADSRPTWNAGGFLTYDGSADFHATAAIDLTGTDAITVGAAATRLADDGGQGVLVENSATIVSNNGTFSMGVPPALGALVGFRSKGTTLVSIQSATAPAPYTAVLVGQADISADSVLIRANGTEVATSGSDQGTGNYGNHAVYFGSRGGTTTYFSGREYQSVLYDRVLTAPEIALLEAFLAGKCGVSF